MARFVAGRLAHAAGRPATVLVTVPAPCARPERVLDLDCAAPAVFWDADDGETFAGVGACHLLEARGEERFEDLRRQADAVSRRFEPAVHDRCEAVSPRFWGGLAFESGGADDGAWAPFGDAFFLLPRWLYRLHGTGASLTLAVRGEEIAATGVRSWLEATCSLLAALSRRGPDAPPVAVAEVEPPPAARFLAAVRGARRAITAGTLDKVVVAQRARVRAPWPLSPSALLGRLPAVGLTRFALRRGGHCFVGATPELLVHRAGGCVESEALAGSAAAGRTEARRLMASPKERHEHQLVVRAVGDRLRPLCRALSVPEVPGIRVLRGLQHLATPIRGTLAAPVHVLHLAAELHPTPAVAGVPGDAAREWIRRHEAVPRGWYAAPVGWFDAAGDGRLAVALRSCLLAGREARVYAGAGIVAGSDPVREYRETELKMQTLLRALGVPPGTSTIEVAAAVPRTFLPPTTPQSMETRP